MLPKLKTNKGAAKRFKRTATGKLKRAKSHKSHILEKKSRKRKRRLKKLVVVHSTSEKKIKKVLGG